MKKIFYYILSIIVTAVTVTSCIEDGFTSSPSSQPIFSVDTLAMGTLFTGEGSPTYTFKVYNRADKSISIDHISLRDDDDNMFRLNVDGLAGHKFNDVEIRANDSIFIFVEVTLPDMGLTEPTLYERHIDFRANGITSTVVLTATGLDATRLEEITYNTDTRLEATRPYIVYGTLTVAEGATLTLDPGVKLHFHDGASLQVDGSLKSNGAPGNLVEMTGDRWGNVVGRVDYEIMSGQWEGVYFTPASRANSMRYTSIRNTMWGVVVDSVPYTDTTPSLSMLNCQLRNSKDYVLVSSHSSVEALGCELADASSGVVALQGGKARLVNCTVANYYLFTALGGPAVQFYHAFPVDAETDGIDLPLLEASLDNCIIYGNGIDLSHGDLTESNITVRRCLLSSEGTDDDQFINCLWGLDPLYGTIRQEYHFDYRLHAQSPAISAADPELIPDCLTDDINGELRLPGLSLGAYAGIILDESE